MHFPLLASFLVNSLPFLAWQLLSKFFLKLCNASNIQSVRELVRERILSAREREEPGLLRPLHDSFFLRKLHDQVSFFLPRTKAGSIYRLLASFKVR
nr:hypothetical protein Q903MT_gene6524 [Picea sitchensis]